MSRRYAVDAEWSALYAAFLDEPADERATDRMLRRITQAQELRVIEERIDTESPSRATPGAGRT